MGSPDTDANAESYEKPQHNVTLTKGYYMGKYEVTNAQFAEFLNEKNIGSDGKDGTKLLIEEYKWGVQYNSNTNKWEPASGYANHPVVYVTWYGANEYASWIGGALPTEAQWEWACRAGSETIYPWGDSSTDIDMYAWYAGNSTATTHPIGEKQPNVWGLYDMIGNVYEWCANWWYIYSSTDQTDPVGLTSGTSRMYRGVGWNSAISYCRSAYRNYDTPHSGRPTVGFRVIFEEFPIQS